jgi:DNA-binding transcriptional ArsR family regulator
VAIRIETDASALARSRFAISPAVEVVTVLRGRRGSGHPHLRRWHARALSRLDARTTALLHALVPVDHPYVPDFLTPHPTTPRETPKTMVDAIKSISPEAVARELDLTFDGRAVRPEYVATFGGEAPYLSWRRPVPDVLQVLLDAGEHVLLHEAAEAMGRFFDAALAEQWPQVLAVLEADIAHRAETMATHGIATMLQTLSPDLRWTGSELVLPRPYDVTVDWADDGLLLIPSATHDGPLLFVAERPRTPVLVYAARGTAALSARPATDDPAKLGALIGRTRLDVLTSLAHPRTTLELAHLDHRSPATVSYHLGVLADCGLVTSRRNGRGVVYRRTALGDALVEGEITAPSAEDRPLDSTELE